MAKLQGGTRIYGAANVDGALIVNTSVNAASYNIGTSFIANTTTVVITNPLRVANSTANVFFAASNGNIGLSTITPGFRLEVNGSFAATTKSFVIDHPTQPGMMLRYGSLEGPENGVYFRGKLEGQSVITLPEYWWKLIDSETITVNLTPYGSSQDLWVQSTSAYHINLNQPANCFFTVYAERKDVAKLVVEF